jgi:hypothetical protein
MKSYSHSIFLLAIVSLSIIVSNCSKEEKAKPFINYIRVTNPGSADSLIASASQGQMIAIMGGNLASVNQVWFNDQKSSLLPTLVTNTTIITRVPSQIPSSINNKLKLIFANGDSLLYDFSVDINKPLVDHVRSEYVNEGDSLFVYGNYFYKPLTVTFTGGAAGEVLSVAADAQSMVIKVPAGAKPGPITVTTNFGQKASDFWFRDNRNLIASFDIPLVNGIWDKNDVVSSDPSIANINNNFLRVSKGALAAWPFLEVYEGTQGSDLSVETKNIPEEAFVNPGSYTLKFEINTQASLAGAYMRFYLGNDNGCCGGDFGAARNTIYYVWVANVSTNGRWATVTIPWQDVFTANNQFAFNSSGYGMAIYFHGPNPANYNFGIDNIRVVPNK